ncbi:MAG TPA: hemerythrin family protein [Azospirillum sp.]|nr:hemerythrin family protein [Azospirillum sp.]
MHGLEGAEELLVGVASVDQEHEQLASRVNRCIAAGEGDLSDDEVRGLVAEVIVFAIEHFANEEQVMLRLGYPGVDAHIDAHEKAVRQLYTYGLNKHGAALSASVGFFLKSWFLAHANTHDRAFGQWVAERAVEPCPVEP